MTDTADTDVQTRVRRLVADIAPGPTDGLSNDSRLQEDLEYDSFNLVVLAAAIEEEFQLTTLAEETALDVTTVGDVENLVTRLLRAQKS